MTEEKESNLNGAHFYNVGYDDFQQHWIINPLLALCQKSVQQVKSTAHEHTVNAEQFVH